MSVSNEWVLPLKVRFRLSIRFSRDMYLKLEHFAVILATNVQFAATKNYSCNSLIVAATVTDKSYRPPIAVLRPCCLQASTALFALRPVFLRPTAVHSKKFESGYFGRNCTHLIRMMMWKHADCFVCRTYFS